MAINFQERSVCKLGQVFVNIPLNPNEPISYEGIG